MHTRRASNFQVRSRAVTNNDSYLSSLLVWCEHERQAFQSTARHWTLESSEPRFWASAFVDFLPPFAFADSTQRPLIVNVTGLMPPIDLKFKALLVLP